MSISSKRIKLSGVPCSGLGNPILLVQYNIVGQMIGVSLKKYGHLLERQEHHYRFKSWEQRASENRMKGTVWASVVEKAWELDTNVLWTNV